MTVYAGEILKLDEFGNLSIVTLEIDDDDDEYSSGETVADVRIDGVSIGNTIPVSTGGTIEYPGNITSAIKFTVGTDTYYIPLAPEIAYDILFAGEITGESQTLTPAGIDYLTYSLIDSDATSYTGVALEVRVSTGAVREADVLIFDDDAQWNTTDAETSPTNREIGDDALARFIGSAFVVPDVNTDDLDPTGPSGTNLVIGTLNYDTASASGLTAQALRFETQVGANLFVHYLPHSPGGVLSFDPADVTAVNSFTVSSTEVTAIDYIEYGGVAEDNVNVVTGTAAAETLIGTAGLDFIQGNDNADTLVGLFGIDFLFGGEGDDLIYGGAGNDNIQADFGQDTAYGGAGDDQITMGADADLVYGGIGNDSIQGGSETDTVYGGAGNDTLDGGGQADFIDGGDGDDVLIGSGGSDTLRGGAGNDSINGGVGLDLVDYTDAPGAVTVSLALGAGTAGEAVNDTFIDIEGVIGSTFGDRLIAAAAGSTLDGGAGDDVLLGGTGADLIRGGADDDTVYGGGGNDTIEGGDGADRLNGANGAETVFGGAGLDIIKTQGGNDVIDGGDDGDTILSGLGDDVVEGGAGDDVIKASEGNDTLTGGTGNDFFNGWRGFDSIVGGEGSDVIYGDFDEDRLEGGPGDNDRLLGGPDRDTFVFRDGFGEDRILDFNPYLEKLDLSGHSGASSFADLKVTQVSTNTVITFIDPLIDDRIVLANVEAIRISTSDFIF